MSNTIQIAIPCDNEEIMEQLIAQLSSSFDAFEERMNELVAFTKQEDFDPVVLESVLSAYNLHYDKILIEDQNWNALWESNFDPVVVRDFCAIRADFHPPSTNTQHEIIITPKMSFGTGHHATTFMMLNEMSKIDFKNKKVADFGTGTGVLAILAEKLGSKGVLAIDIDDWSIENARENIDKNGCKNVAIQKADGFLATGQFDIILANINKNVILSNANAFEDRINQGGKILLSGLLKEDENEIVTVFASKGIKHQSTVERNRWICLLLQSQ
ncbi:MAG: 50S ribosomal protein L11 methyltransferase [Bacteroidota bacterium]|nr:50S ribosomal protein L11 methyltransferase [Bacteroidota bacterium]